MKNVFIETSDRKKIDNINKYEGCKCITMEHK